MTGSIEAHPWWVETYRFSSNLLEDATNHDLPFLQRITSLAVAILTAIFTYPIYQIAVQIYGSPEQVESHDDPRPDERPPPVVVQELPPEPARIDLADVAPAEVALEAALERLDDLSREYSARIRQLEIPEPWQTISIAGEDPVATRQVFLADLALLQEQLRNRIQVAEDVGQCLQESETHLEALYASMVHISRANDPDYPRPFYPGRVGFQNKKDLSDCGWLSRVVGSAHSSRINYVLLRPIQDPGLGFHEHRVEQDPHMSRQAISEMIRDKNRHRYHERYDQGRQIRHDDLVELQRRLLGVIRTMQTGTGANNDNPDWRYYNHDFDGIRGNRHASGYHMVTDLLTLFRYTWSEDWLPFPVEERDDGGLQKLNIKVDLYDQRMWISPELFPHLREYLPDLIITNREQKMFEIAADAIEVQLDPDAQFVQLNAHQKVMIETMYGVTLSGGDEIMALVRGRNLVVATTEDNRYEIDATARVVLETMFASDWRVIRLLSDHHYRLIVKDAGGDRLRVIDKTGRKIIERDERSSMSSIDNQNFLPYVAPDRKRDKKKKEPEHQYTDPAYFLYSYLESRGRAPFNKIVEFTFMP